MKMLSDSDRGAGFTLIEVMASLVIFSVGVLAATQLTTGLSLLMRDAGVRSAAVTIAQERMDSLKVVPLATLTEGLSEEATEIQGRPYRILISVVPDGFRSLAFEVLLTPESPPGPEHRVTGMRPAPW